MSEFSTVVLIALALFGIVGMHRRNKRVEIVEMMLADKRPTEEIMGVLSAYGGVIKVTKREEQ